MEGERKERMGRTERGRGERRVGDRKERERSVGNQLSKLAKNKECSNLPRTRSVQPGLAIDTKYIASFIAAGHHQQAPHFNCLVLTNSLKPF